MPGILVEGAFELIDAAEIGEGGAGSGVRLAEAGDGLRDIAVGIAGLIGGNQEDDYQQDGGQPAPGGLRDQPRDVHIYSGSLTSRPAMIGYPTQRASWVRELTPSLLSMLVT